MLIVLVAALLASAGHGLAAGARAGTADAVDRHTRTILLPQGKTLSLDVTIGTVRIEGWDRAEAEIVVNRRAPDAAALARVPLVIEDLPARASVRVLQTHDTTDPAIRADVAMRVPRQAVIERVQVFEGRIEIDAFAGAVTADIRRGAIEGTGLSGTLRLESGIGSVTVTDARLSANGLLRLRAFNGDVRLSLAARPADARILALALNGQIKSDIPLKTRDTWGPRWGEASLGKGEPVISLDVVTGLIEIKSP